MKAGDLVQCLVNMQPLKIGDQGTVKQINHNLPFPITVYFPDVQLSLPMKSSELKKIA